MTFRQFEQDVKLSMGLAILVYLFITRLFIGTILGREDLANQWQWWITGVALLAGLVWSRRSPPAPTTQCPCCGSEVLSSQIRRHPAPLNQEP